MIENAEPWWDVKAENNSEPGPAWWEEEQHSEGFLKDKDKQSDEMSFWNLLLKNPTAQFFSSKLHIQPDRQDAQ